MTGGVGKCALALAGLAALAVFPYVRSVTLPPISDDYLQIGLARQYGPVQGWHELASDALYRCRATSLVLTHWTERLFGVSPLVINLSSLALHILNVWLIFALGFWRPLGWRLAFLAAAFFAVYEGHQEAVIWYSALPELLVFTFIAAAFLFWIRWLQRGAWWCCAGALMAFALALLSKESGAAFVGLALLPVVVERARWKRWAAPWVAMTAIAAGYAAAIYYARDNHLFFYDGTFELQSGFLLVLWNSTGRMLWFWGALSLLVLAAHRAREYRRLAALAAGWAVIAFLPYSFITYMPRVPSRHTYLASLALSWIVAAAALVLWRNHKRAAAVLGAVLVLHNAGYVWMRKHAQFAERAEPTERLVEFARGVRGPVNVHCFTYGLDAARWAVRVGAEKEMHAASTHDSPDVFCYPPHPRQEALQAGAQ
ncbi:MAG: hypothetical protein ACE15B_13840 [Bryobacteraceae bacterium]